jgi:hypothetical protein
MLIAMRPVSLLVLLWLAAAPLQSQHRSDLITADEIEAVIAKGATAFDVVQTLRPRWLKVRDAYLGSDPSSIINSQGAHVYLDDHDQGDVEYLKTIPAERIAQLRWISATEAGARYGPTDGPGIVVTLKH